MDRECAVEGPCDFRMEWDGICGIDLIDNVCSYDYGYSGLEIYLL